MKRVFFALMILFISATISCKKEVLTNKEVSGSSLNTTLQENILADNSATTLFGVLPSGLQNEKRMSVAKSLDVNYIRKSIDITRFYGRDAAFHSYHQHGFKVLLNLNYGIVENARGERSPRPFPTDMVRYKKLIEKVLISHKPEIAVIENEPLNQNYYTGDIENYITELTNAIDVCKQHGIKVADGGLTARMLCVLVYQDYVNRGMTDKAAHFANRALNDWYLRAALGRGNDEVNAKIEKAKKLVAAYKSLALDYVNIHWYEPLKPESITDAAAPGVLTEIADYLRNATGKEIMTNEFGQYNDSPELMKSLMQSFKSLNFKYAVVFSGDNVDRATSLSNGNHLTPVGEAFKSAVW